VEPRQEEKDGKTKDFELNDRNHSLNLMLSSFREYGFYAPAVVTKCLNIATASKV